MIDAATIAAIDELVRRGFLKRKDDGSLVILPKCTEQEHREELAQLLGEFGIDLDKLIN